MTIGGIGRVVWALCVVLLLATTQALDATASNAIRPAPGAPDPKLMVLAPADLGPRVKVTSQCYYKDNSFPSVISYAREMERGMFHSLSLP